MYMCVCDSHQNYTSKTISTQNPNSTEFIRKWEKLIKKFTWTFKKPRVQKNSSSGMKWEDMLCQESRCIIIYRK